MNTQAKKNLIKSYMLAYRAYVMLNREQPRTTKAISWIVRQANLEINRLNEQSEDLIALGQSYYWVEYPAEIMQQYGPNRKLTTIETRQLAHSLINEYTTKETI